MMETMVANVVALPAECPGTRLVGGTRPNVPPGLGTRRDLLTALMIPPLLARIRAEERLLRTQFGAEYDAYCAQTSRLIPGLY